MCILLLATSTIQPVRPTAPVYYAVVIQGDDDPTQLESTAYFVRWCVEHLFDVPRANIKYLATPYSLTPSYIDYDDIATYENVRYYIGEWLANQPGFLFVYVASHGGGFNLTDLCGGRWDADGDEGDEHYVDGEWKGVDECILLKADESKYWDDEFREDVSDINKSLTVIFQTCKVVKGSSNGSCFSGGFIDDLSNVYKRTLISSANETGVSYVDGSVAEFTYYFMNGLSDLEIVYNGPYTYFDESSPINSYKSWRGAYEYALLHDPFYLGTYPGFPECVERPWFDDDGDGLPTYVNDMQVLDFPENGEDLMRWLKCDVNYDGIVDMTDLGIVGNAYGSTPGDSNWNTQADVYPYEDWIVEMSDVGEVSMYYGLET